MLRIDRHSANGPVGETGSSSAQRRVLQKACDDFEALVLKQMLDGASPEAEEGGYFGGGAGADTFRHLHTTHLSEAAAGAGGLGISQMLFTRLSSRLAAAEPAADNAQHTTGTTTAGADTQ